MIKYVLADTARELCNRNISIGFTDIDEQFCRDINKITKPKPEVKFLGKIPGNWIKDNDMLLNAWDPHSLLGNGLAKDNTLDGFIGRSTLIHFMHALICSMHNSGVIGKPRASQQETASNMQITVASEKIPLNADPVLNVNTV